MIHEKVSKYQPDHVVVFLGSVDLSYRNTTLFATYYSWLIDELARQLTTAKLYLVEFPWMNRGYDDLYSSYHQAIYDQADEKDLPMSSLFNSTFNQPSLFRDGIHPNDQGAELFANLLHNDSSPFIKSEEVDTDVVITSSSSSTIPAQSSVETTTSSAFQITEDDLTLSVINGLLVILVIFRKKMLKS